MSLIQILRKQGGLKLFQQYAKAGALPICLCDLIFLGKSRTALEILRLSAQLKIKQKLGRKYKGYIQHFETSYDQEPSHCVANKIWLCWLQGIENAPELVKTCYESLKLNLSSKDIVLITADNLSDYVQFPDHITEKWKRGIISHTHLTDLLRLELLIKYGGTWIDATVLCTEDEKSIPSYFFESDLFFYQCLKPGRDGHSTYISSWFMSAKSNNKMLIATRELCYEYWKRNNSMIDYFLLHDFLSIVLDFYAEEWRKIIPRDNATPHELLLRFFDEYDDDTWNVIKAQTPFHKLSYKFSSEQTKKENTFYKVIMKI